MMRKIQWMGASWPNMGMKLSYSRENGGVSHQETKKTEVSVTVNLKKYLDFLETFMQIPTQNTR